MSIFSRSKKNSHGSLSGRDVAALPPAPVSLVSAGSKLKGEIVSSDQLQIDGAMEGTLIIKNHVIIGKTGIVSANLRVKSLQVFGKLIGDVESLERVSIERSGSIEGNIIAPKLAISEGALFRGNIDMSQKLNSSTQNKDKNTDEDKLDLRKNINIRNPVNNES